MEKQEEMTALQIELAIELQKPLTLHCVHAYHELLHLLKKYFGPSKPHTPGIVLHSFSGPRDLVPKFAEMNCFFSIGPLVGHSKKTQEAVAAVPAERLMLETDAPDQFCSHEMEKLKWLVDKAASEGVPIPPVRENRNPFKAYHFDEFFVNISAP